MIANGAKYGSSALRLLPVVNLLVDVAKYTNAMIVTTMMLPSRSVRKRWPRLSAPPR